jgi:hypothetical protein
MQVYIFLTYATRKSVEKSITAGGRDVTIHSNATTKFNYGTWRQIITQTQSSIF